MIKPHWLFAAVIGVAMSAAHGAESVGTIKSVKGQVQVLRGGDRLPAAPGMAVFEADQVRTGTDGAVGITLKDETLLSAGASAVLNLDRFVFDQTTYAGSMKMTLKQGKFAVTTGKMAKTVPESVEFQTPSSIIGVRGTEFAVEVAGHDAD